MQKTREEEAIVNYDGVIRSTNGSQRVGRTESGHPKMAAAPGALASLIAHTTTQGSALYMYNSVVMTVITRQQPLSEKHSTKS